MLTNAKRKINPKRILTPLGAPPVDACQLQHLRTLLGLSRRRLQREDVLRFIDRREIGWAWDISRSKARRAEIRIWRESLTAFLAREAGQTTTRARKWTLEEVVADILPRPVTPFSPRLATVTVAELQRRLLCTSRHVLTLLKDGEFASISPDPRHPAILYQGAYEFLKRRCLSL